jgi:hypothetical protein
LRDNRNETPTVGKNSGVKPLGQAPEYAAIGWGDPENIDNA